MELYSHQENTTSFENMFKKDFENLNYEFEKVGNPIFEDKEMLQTLVTKNVMYASANKSVYEARTLGAEHYSSYKKGVFALGSKSFFETIKLNTLSLYKITNTVVISKTQKKVVSLKQDCQLYSNLYVACQNREGDLEEFFAYENHAYPPSLSIYGEMHSTDKSDTIKIPENVVETSSVKPDFTAEVLDGAAVVQAVVPKDSINFGQYCRNEFTAYLFNEYRQSTLNSVDIVFDIYLDHGIKNLTRNKRGFGKRIKKAGDTPIPRHWKSFLHLNENKTQLFQLLAGKLVQQTNFKQFVATKDIVIVTNTDEN